MSSKPLFLGGLALALLIGLFAGRLLFAPGHHSASDHEHHDSAAAAAHATTDWTCSMHPQIRQPNPGKCPICAMDLIPAGADQDNDAGPRTLVMSESARALAAIQTARVERRFPETTVRLVGQLDYDETRLRSLAARFPARIDRLFVNFTGVTVAAGEHLARIYSPELITAQRELLSAHAADHAGVLAQAAREKLRRWDLLSAQIDAILGAGRVEESFELLAPAGGIVIAKNIKEGDYVKTGDPLFRIADLDELWLHLAAFESDLGKLRYGQDVTFTVEAWPGETFTGRIAFIAPDVDRRTRTVPVRVNVPNPDGRLKPGMFARGQVRVKLAADNTVFSPDLAGKWISPMHPEIVKDGPGSCDVCGMDLVPAATLGHASRPAGDAPLVVPASAVLRTGRRAVVYVAQPHAAEPTFEGRVVELGAEVDGAVIIASGLREGDLVVTQGAFKIDSALQILAKPSMMNPADDDSAHADAGTSHPAAIAIAADQLPKLLPPYFKLQAALADDDLTAAQAALRELMAVTGHHGPLPDLIHTLLAAKDLAAIRRPGFEQLSDALIAAAKAHPEALPSAVYRMHCPMVYDDRGADWLQATEDLRNPYFGDAMLFCGEQIEQWDEGQGTGDEGPIKPEI